MVKYRLTFANGGYFESYELSDVMTMRNNPGGAGTVTAIDVSYTISNDPEYRKFESADEANAVIQQLQSDTFVLQPQEVLVTPQPEGLN